ncbi:N-acetylneuraminate synthase [Desulfobaculum xiamenense]|uniref:N-acetylneuraminate synthase n=1 Tax=Desulfobaculum xiamenense TaxID=995050 RepID=A0A846QM07_9BACT|nr:N-acetylneuraminate synthase family protein [Desulfobaculum xiamenense]NJB69198.1 N-acetylneuraminate synthase [Desulfobaculum xiamenense]
MAATVTLDGTDIGTGRRVYFMAEVAGNFAGEEEAARIVDSAMRAGADAVKFQTLDPETITTRANRFDMPSVGTRLQREVFAESRTPPEVQAFLVDYCKRRGVTVFSAPSHVRDLEFMERLDLPAYKIGSDLATHIPLLEIVADTGKPIFLSTGMCTMAEVRDSVEAILARGNDRLLLFHCVSNYPADPAEQNLRAMVAMKREFGLPTGFSDHTVGIDCARAAVALGADMIERHYWCEGNAEGSDRALSSDEAEFRRLVDYAAHVLPAFGDGVKRPTPAEERNMRTNKVSLIVMRDVAAGDVLDETILDVRRPGTGLAPKWWRSALGRRVLVPIAAETPLRPEHIGLEVEP